MRNEKVEKKSQEKTVKKSYRRPTLQKRQRLVEVTEGEGLGGATA
jgi:hypothetical protein